MALSLIYHRNNYTASPFDACAVDLARDASLRIASPYLTLDYLRRLIALSSSWRLLTDVEEWLTSLASSDRKTACDFMIENEDQIRHFPSLHAKVLIGTSRAMVGSSNLTTSGIQRRTEMAVLIDDFDCHLELCNWFEDTWSDGHALPTDRIYHVAESLPDPLPRYDSTLTIGFPQRLAPLITLDEDRDIRTYLGSRGYYIGKQFCVMKGSLAAGRVVNAFRKTNNGLYNSIRNRLIRRGILARSQELEDYVFTEDYVFDSASAAACIVSGQSRSGPKEWGRP